MIWTTRALIFAANTVGRLLEATEAERRFDDAERRVAWHRFGIVTGMDGRR